MTPRTRPALVLAALGLGLGGGIIATMVPQGVLIGAACLASLAGSLWLMQKTVRVFDLTRITIPGLWYLTYLVTIYVPSMLIAVFRFTPLRDPYFVLAGPHLSVLLFAVNSILITGPLGIWAASAMLKFQPREIAGYFAAGVDETGNRAARLAAFAVVAAGAAFMSFLYFADVLGRLGTIPVLDLLTLHGRTLAQLRIGSLVALGSPLRYSYAILIETVYPFLIAAAFGQVLYRPSAGWVVVFAGTLLPGLLSAAASAARSEVAVIIAVTLALVYLYRGGKVGGKFWWLSLPVILMFPVFVTVEMYRIDLWYALKMISVRLAYTSAYVQYLYFHVVPAQIGFLYGRTSTMFALLTGQPYFDMQEYAARIPYPNAPANAMASGPLIGDLYVNFGLAGVLLGGGLAGFLIGTLQIWLVRRPKTIAHLALYALFLHAAWRMSDRPLPVTLWSGGVFFGFLTLAVLAMMEALFTLRGQPGSPVPDTSG